MKEFVMSPNCPLYNDINLGKHAGKHPSVCEGGRHQRRRRREPDEVLLSLAFFCRTLLTQLMEIRTPMPPIVITLY